MRLQSGVLALLLASQAYAAFQGNPGNIPPQQGDAMNNVQAQGVPVNQGPMNPGFGFAPQTGNGPYFMGRPTIQPAVTTNTAVIQPRFMGNAPVTIVSSVQQPPPMAITGASQTGFNAQQQPMNGPVYQQQGFFQNQGFSQAPQYPQYQGSNFHHPQVHMDGAMVLPNQHIHQQQQMNTMGGAPVVFPPQQPMHAATPNRLVLISVLSALNKLTDFFTQLNQSKPLPEMVAQGTVPSIETQTSAAAFSGLDLTEPEEKVEKIARRQTHMFDDSDGVFDGLDQYETLQEMVQNLVGSSEPSTSGPSFSVSSNDASDDSTVDYPNLPSSAEIQNSDEPKKQQIVEAEEESVMEIYQAEVVSMGIPLSGSDAELSDSNVESVPQETNVRRSGRISSRNPTKEKKKKSKSDKKSKNPADKKDKSKGSEKIPARRERKSKQTALEKFAQQEKASKKAKKIIDAQSKETGPLKPRRRVIAQPEPEIEEPAVPKIIPMMCPRGWAPRRSETTESSEDESDLWSTGFSQFEQQFTGSEVESDHGSDFEPLGENENLKRRRDDDEKGPENKKTRRG